jgi:hypothetical protein
LDQRALTFNWPRRAVNYDDDEEELELRPPDDKDGWD